MKTVIEEVKNNWTQIMLIVGLIIWGVQITAKLETTTAQANESKSSIEELLDMKTDIAVIKTDINYIKEKVK